MSSVILEAHDLTKEYRHTVALDHMTTIQRIRAFRSMRKKLK